MNVLQSINIGREDLASFAGTTTETCVRVLTQFKEEEILITEGRKLKLKTKIN
ncbi:MAG: winged helix-turn-helix domain-containing protein [Sphingobacteriaceae bacterium]|nr:winged helix-turn-helix domain-containing protein [Sphingobacteriaceae bacterium]